MKIIDDSMTKGERAVFLLAVAAALGAAGILFYGTALTAFLAPLAFRPAEKMWLKHKENASRNRLREGFRDLLTALAASAASGRHMKEAMAEAKENLGEIYDGDHEIMVALRQITERMELGETDIGVLRAFAEEARIEDVTLFVQVYGSCRETGGDLAGAMLRASEILGDKIRIESDIRSMTKQKKTEGAVIGAMPFLILLFLRAASPGYTETLYGNAAGIFVMTVSAAAVVFSYYLIRKITEIRV